MDYMITSASNISFYIIIFEDVWRIPRIITLLQLRLEMMQVGRKRNCLMLFNLDR